MSCQFNVSLYTWEELNASPKLLHDICHAINLAFVKNEEDGFVEPRFAHDDELLEMLGPEGLCAAVHGETGILASASVLPWRPADRGPVMQALRDCRPNDLLLVEQGLSFQVKAVVTADKPESRGKGLVELCVKELVSRLLIRHHGNHQLLLWIQLVEDQYGSYWRRRGYEQVGPVETKEKGTWGSNKDFKFATLVKRVSTISTND